jgi:putative nucleotidyltransferase with HDIG domain
MDFPVPLELKAISAVFRARGKAVYLAGGAVRDMVMGKSAADYDLATDARPEELMRMFRSVIPTGIRHGTVTVRFKGTAFEVTTFRTDGVYRDGRRPESVSFAASIEDDLSRRDFTMNAMALSLPNGALVDPFGGRADIERRRIRCVGESAARFAEDGLRPLRAVRFCARLGFTLDDALLAAIPAALPVTAKVSAERVRDELDKILACRAPLAALRAMEHSGLLALILPELAACRGVEQRGLHAFDVLDHSLYALEYACEHDFSPAVRLAALLHDIGKVSCAAWRADTGRQPDGVWTFYNHEKVSARMCGEVLRRLRYPNSVVDEVTHLVEAHMFHYEAAWNDAAVRRFIARVGEDCLDALFRLRRADVYGFRREAPPDTLLLPFQEHIAAVRSAAHAFSLKDLAVNGNDLQALGIPGGREIGRILRVLLDAVLTDPSLNSREALLALARDAQCA